MTLTFLIQKKSKSWLAFSMTSFFMFWQKLTLFLWNSKQREDIWFNFDLFRLSFDTFKGKKVKSSHDFVTCRASLNFPMSLLGWTANVSLTKIKKFDYFQSIKISSCEGEVWITKIISSSVRSFWAICIPYQECKKIISFLHFSQLPGPLQDHFWLFSI